MSAFNIKVQNDRITNVTDTLIYLSNCTTNNREASFFIDESPDLECVCIGEELFIDFLRSFCDRCSFDPKKISIEIENLIQSECWPNLAKCYRSVDVFYGQSVDFKCNKDIKYKSSLFVGGSRWPRLSLASFLYANYRDDSLITYHQSLKDRNQPCYLYMDDLFKYHMLQGVDNNLLEQVKDFVGALPLHLDQDDHKGNDCITEVKNLGYINFDQAYKLVPWYNQVYCDIVCETVHNGQTFAFTEKIARCWLTKTPFLAFAPKNYLANLRRLGFETFDLFWSEHYDNYENVNRIKMIQGLIKQIHGMNLKELGQIYQSSAMQKILDNNLRVFKSLTQEKILDCFN
jgi:hypothetical protein